MVSPGKTYTFIFSTIYLIVSGIAVFIYRLQFSELLITLLFVGITFPFLSWWLTRNIDPIIIDKPLQKNEHIVLTMLVFWVVLYITWGGDFINGLLSKELQQNQQWQFFIIIARKFFVFVLVPYLVYRALGFTIKDFGLKISASELFSKTNMILLLLMSVFILVFEYFFSTGAETLRQSHFTSSQLMIAIPTTFVWLYIEAGLIEEFFFRALLQSRLAALIKSEWGAILMGGLIFGLARVLGLYLRGAESEGISEQLPVWFWLSYCVVNMSIGGIFLGIIWSKTKNIYLVMFLHAMVDLLPNVGAFIHTWKI